MNTIDTILKIAKVKDIESFYKKFPSEEDFLKVHEKEFKKAMKGAKIPKAQDGFNMSNKLNANMNDWFNVQNAGLSQEDQLKLNPLQTWNFPKQEFMSGKSLPIKPNNINKGLSMVGDVVKGFQMLKDEKNKMLEAQQWRDVSDVQLQASNLQPERINNRYLRPEDMSVTGEEMFPSYGTGSNALAKYGIRIAKDGDKVPNFPTKMENIKTSSYDDRPQLKTDTRNQNQRNMDKLYTAYQENKPQLFKDFPITDPYQPLVQYITGKGDESSSMAILPTPANASLIKKWKAVKLGGQDAIQIGGKTVLTGKKAKDFITKTSNNIGYTSVSPEQVTAAIQNEGRLISRRASKNTPVIGKPSGSPYGYYIEHSDISDIVPGQITNQGKFSEKKDIIPRSDFNIFDENSTSKLMRIGKGGKKTYITKDNYLENLEDNAMRLLSNYKDGGNIDKNTSKWKKAKSGAGVPWGDVGNTTSNILEGIMGEDGGGTIGGSIGKTAGTLIGGPIGGAIGQVGGQVIGSLLDTRPERTKSYLNQAGRNASLMMANAGVQGIHDIYSGYMEDGGVIKPIQPNLQPYQQQELIPIPSVYDATRSFNKKGVTYLQEKEKLDKELNLLESKKKLSAEDKMLIIKNKESQYDLMNHQLNSMKDGGKVTGMEADGELQMLENKGDIKSLSYNPFLPDGGETVQFEGDSHAQGGMNIAFGNTPVEVEGGEPATKMDNDSLVVYGDLVAPGYKGKKFKNVVKDISKKEEKQNKIIEKSIEDFENTDVQTSFDKLKVKTLETNIKGATMKQKELAQEKEHLASLQEAINQAADEQNLDASALAKGKIKKAKKSDRNMAQDGKTVPDSLYKAYGFQPVTNPTMQQMSEAIMEMQNRQNAVFGYPPQIPQSYTPYPDTPVSNVNQQNGQDWEPLPELLPIIRPDVEEPTIPVQTTKTGTSKGTGTAKSSTVEATNEFQPVDQIEYIDGIPQVGSTMVSDSGIAKEEMNKLAKRINKGKSKKERVSGEDLWNTLSSLIPYFKPSDVEGLDPSQIAGELAALSDREEPVWAQTLQPDLASPYEISLQDQKNEVIASSRAAQRMTGNNPAAQAMIASQTSDALNKIQGEEFRINQGMKDKVFTENRNLMNQTRFQNLEILDKLYERQSMAKSKTKDTLRSALNSISDKYLKNRFENRTLATYENLYDYRFDDRGRAWYMGRPASWNTQGSEDEYASTSYDEDYVPRYERDPKTGRERVVGTRRRTKGEQTTARNGAIVRALKRI